MRKHERGHGFLNARLEHEIELLEGILAHLRLSWLLRRFPARPVWAAFVCINGFVSIALLSTVAMLSHTSFVFPSLGPTAYMLFFTPRAAVASPKHVVCGHLIGLICGWGSLWATGLLNAPPATTEGINTMRMLSAALSLGLTGAAMVLLNVSHPPAGATTLIVSLGFITQTRSLLVIEAAVIAMVAYAFVINRVSGVDYPLWTPRRGPVPLPRPQVT